MVLIHRQNAIREFIDGEAHVKGFLLAYLGLTQGYILLPEYESSKGYADFYMMLKSYVQHEGNEMCGVLTGTQVGKNCYRICKISPPCVKAHTRCGCERDATIDE